MHRHRRRVTFRQRLNGSIQFRFALMRANALRSARAKKRKAQAKKSAQLQMTSHTISSTAEYQRKPNRELHPIIVWVIVIFSLLAILELVVAGVATVIQQGGRLAISTPMPTPVPIGPLVLGGEFSDFQAKYGDFTEGTDMYGNGDPHDQIHSFGLFDSPESMEYSDPPCQDTKIMVAKV